METKQRLCSKRWCVTAKHGDHFETERGREYTTSAKVYDDNWVRVPVADPCEKCGGTGWLWWSELDEYEGPANETGQDDQRYLCDKCEGSESTGGSNDG